jgi:hypothetical protein
MTEVSRLEVPTLFKEALPLLLLGGVLFEDNPLSGPVLSEHGFSIVSEIAVKHKTALSILDLQCIVLRYCTYIESPQASFHTAQKMIIVLTQLIKVIGQYASMHKEEMRIILSFWVNYSGSTLSYYTNICS